MGSLNVYSNSCLTNKHFCRESCKHFSYKQLNSCLPFIQQAFNAAKNQIAEKLHLLFLVQSFIYTASEHYSWNTCTIQDIFKTSKQLNGQLQTFFKQLINPPFLINQTAEQIISNSWTAARSHIPLPDFFPVNSWTQRQTFLLKAKVFNSPTWPSYVDNC